VAIDKFTKWIEVKPVTCPKADRVLNFLDELVHRYGLPHRIITDLGSNFNNHQFWEYCENSGIEVRYVSVAICSRSSVYCSSVQLAASPPATTSTGALGKYDFMYAKT
jgi:hypothetical protein